MATVADSSTKTTVISGDDLSAAGKDSKVGKLVTAAKAYGARLRAAGKDHSLRSSDRASD